MPRADKYGKYRQGRLRMTCICNDGNVFEVYRLVITEVAAQRASCSQCMCVVVCNRQTHCQEMVTFITLLPAVYIAVHEDDIVSLTAVDSRVSPLLYERPPRMAFTAMLGRHERDMHVVPSAARGGRSERQEVRYRVTGLHPDHLRAALMQLLDNGQVTSIRDCSADPSLARGVSAHRTLPDPQQPHFTEICCCDSDAYWASRDAIAQSSLVSADFDTCERGDVRWLSAEGSEWFEVIINPLNRASEEWNTAGYNQATLAERADCRVFGPTSERHKWFGIFGPIDGTHQRASHDKSADEHSADPSTCVYTWEQLARVVIERMRLGARQGSGVQEVPMAEPLASFVREQGIGQPKAYYRSEASLQPDQNRQLSDAAYVVFVRGSSGIGCPSGPSVCQLMQMSTQAQASWIICMCYLLHGFQPRRQRGYVPSGRLSGATGRPRSNWKSPVNKQIYNDAVMNQSHLMQIKRSLDGSYVRRNPLLSRTKYPERHSYGALYRPCTQHSKAKVSHEPKRRKPAPNHEHDAPETPFLHEQPTAL